MRFSIWAFLIVFCLSIISSTPVFAVSLSINVPSQLTDQPFPVEVTISGASSGQNYIRVDLYRDQTTNYFGETFNGSDWIDSSDGKMYFPVLIASSQAQVTVQARLGNPSLSEYPGSGPYKLKIRRYTASGGAASNDILTPLDVQINYALPTPTPDPTKVPSVTKIPTPIKTSIPVKESPTPTKFLTATATVKSVLSSKENFSDDDRIYPTAVLGKVAHIKKVSPTATILGVKESRQIDYLPLILLLVGGIFVAICAIIMYRNWRKT